MNKQSEELKNCPFCSSKAILVELGLDGWRVRCSKGCCTAGDSTMSEPEHFKLWNTRPQGLVPLDKAILTEICGLAIGKASLHWEPKPRGVFDSTSAVETVNQLVEAISNKFGRPSPDLPSELEIFNILNSLNTVIVDYIPLRDLRLLSEAIRKFLEERNK